MSDEQNRNAVKLLETLSRCQERMRDIGRLMENKTGNLETDFGIRIYEGRKRGSPEARFFASSQVLPQSSLYIAWRTLFYLKDTQWHTSSTSTLNIDLYPFAPVPWCIYITVDSPKPFNDFSDLQSYLLEQTERHFADAEKIDLRNPLLNSPYEHLYSRIADAHIKAIDAQNLDQSTKELAAVRDEVKTINKE
jgi:hypothetical protein